MAKFKVDTDKIQDTITVYQTAIDDINDAIKNAQDAIDVLKSSGWKTNASKAFFDNFDSSWKTNIGNRVKIIEHLKSCLVNAQSEYEVLITEASQLGNSL